jgi:Na+/H+ antiporter NhaD/arsenite permease-like protein
METSVIIVFIIGYLLIAFEHPLRLNKTASAILTGVLCWTLFIVLQPSANLTSSEHYNTITKSFTEGHVTSEPLSARNLFIRFVGFELSRHLSSISEILFFLMGAMTIVELIDAHNGFRFITEKIRTKNPRWLLVIICFVAFFLSAILDNLTTTIVMVSLIRKLISDKERRMIFVGMIVIAANAGGAWTPMGDVTTTMLWIGGQVSALNIMKTLFLPSVVSMLVPLLLMMFRLRSAPSELSTASVQDPEERVGSGKVMLVIGISVMIGVPVFKMLTGLPPFIGMLAGLGVLWIISEFTHPELDDAVRKNYTAAGALSRIDVPSILFFLGILLAVGALESMHILQHLASDLAEAIGDQRIIISLIGVFSAIVDNVPLVAACMGMFSMETYPTDHFIWEYLAYCAGTGGSLLIIGSAAGVAAMGMEKIDFIWYLKKITLVALSGYVAGAITYLLIAS